MRQKLWFLFVTLFCFSPFHFKHSFLLFRSSGEQSSWRRIFIRFYKAWGLGKGGFSTSLAVLKAGFSALPLCEKSIPLLSRSLARGLGKRASNSHLYYSCRNGRWEWASSFMWHIWNAFHQISQGPIKPVSPSLSLSQGGATATEPVKELPPPCLQLNISQFLSHPLSHCSHFCRQEINLITNVTLRSL